MFLNYFDKVLFLRTSFIVGILLFFLLGSTVAQIPQKKRITEADYNKWASLWTKSLSPSGKWMSYEVDYSNSQDTLFVQSTSDLKKFTIPAGTSGRFIADTYFLCMLPGARLQLLNLSSGTTTVISNVMRFELAAQGKFFIVSDKTYKRKSDLKIYNEKVKLIDSIVSVTEFKLNDQIDEMIFVTNNNGGYQIGMVNFKKYEKLLLPQNSLTKFHQLVWQKNGQSFTYLNEIDSAAKTQVANYYSLEKGLNYKLDQLKDSTKLIYTRKPMVISEDGKFVVISLANRPPNPINKNGVEIWNGNDKSIFPQINKSFGGSFSKIRWNIEKGTYTEISSEHFPSVILNKSMSYAVISNDNAYADNSPSYFPRTDYYLKSIEFGKEQLFLKNHSSGPDQIVFTPKGDQLLYYNEKDWWIYDLLSEKKVNITQKKVLTWDNDSLRIQDGTSQYQLYGIAGWTDDQKSVLVYDQFDLWLIALDGSSCIRLTKGREKQQQFRIADCEYHDRNGNYLGRNVSFNVAKGFLLKFLDKNDWSSGFASYRNGQDVQSIVYGQRLFEQINRTPTGFVFTSQTFDVSPQLMFKGNNDNSPVLLYQSNKHQKNFVYGKSELIRYKGAGEDSLKAAIFYPAGFDASKKYPMIVHPYEIQSKLIHSYENPSLLNSIGFNISNYTANGYIVLLPDIKFKLGDPAVDATNCIVDAVKAVLALGIVIPNKIGLIGHSFGGYQADYVISQTNLFATAVSGAGISDIIGYYFNLSENNVGLPEMWRYETQQQRMGKSLYKDKEGYLRNSPIMSVDQIKTPLLIWSGKRDRVVPMVQSVSMYLALRRLGKETIFLAYPNEDHTLSSPSNQIDLTKRTASWFDYYLKDDKTAEWITKGTK